MLVSSSANHYTTWIVSKFVAHHATVDSIASVAFNTDVNTISVAFAATDEVSMLSESLAVMCLIAALS